MRKLKRVKALKSLNYLCGFTLIEVIVAMAILSLGVLGAASLQAKALRFVQIAENQSLAAQLSHDLVGRMRANSAELTTLSLYEHKSGASVLENTENCSTQPCKPEQLAAYDLSQWLTEVGNKWPSVGTSLQATGKMEASYLLSIRWGAENSKQGNCTLATGPLGHSGCWQTTVVF